MIGHTRPGYCAGCETWVVATVEEVDAEEAKPDTDSTKRRVMLVAQPGDPDQKHKHKNCNMGTWLQRHLSIRYGQCAILDIEPSNWVIDILHLNLRVCGVLLERTVMRRLTKLYDKKRFKDGDDEATMCGQLYHLLQKAGIRIGKLTPPTQKQGAFYWSVKRHSFHGQDAQIAMIIYPSLLKLVYPEDVRTNSPALEAEFQAAMAVWAKYADYVWPLINNLEMDKMAKATRLEVESRAWLELWKTATGGSQTVYIHLMCVHLPEQIRSLPVDPYYFQTSGLEHGNKMRKHIALHLTNHFVGRTAAQVEEDEGLRRELLEAQAVASGVEWDAEELEKEVKKTKFVSGYTRADGKEVEGYYQGYGNNRMTQILRTELIDAVFAKASKDQALLVCPLVKAETTLSRRRLQKLATSRRAGKVETEIK